MLNKHKATGVFIGLLLASFVFAQSAGSFSGQVTDETGAAIPAASVTVLKAGAVVKKLSTSENGSYQTGNLPPGTYSVRVEHFGFAPSENRLTIGAGQHLSFDTNLKLQATQQEITVQGEAVGTVDVDANANANALVLKQAEIDALPDDPDDLATDLQALAGPSAGPNGGQIFIDGFTGGRLPPKESIREIRVNQNPFSSEYDRMGFGRIEILTKPGSDKYHGQAFFNDSDGVFNARNPLLTTDVPDFSSRMFGGNFSGPLGKKASFFTDFQRRNIDDSSVVVATVLDPSFNIVPFNSTVFTPQRRTDFSQRFDYAINANNTLVGRYEFQQDTTQNSGAANLSLASRASNVEGYEHSVTLTETAVIGTNMINETRFRWTRNTDNTTAITPGLAISVSGAFQGGGSSTPYTRFDESRFELQNYTSITHGRHSFKVGLRLRDYDVNQATTQNFLGSYSFANIDAYQQNLLLTNQGVPQSQIAAMGYGPTQFSIAAGTPGLGLNQIDAGLFFQDDWRIKPNLTVNLGLRYEIQNQISDFADFAPRFGFAWSPDSKAGKQGKTVIRGGAGIFYDRFDNDLSLTALRYNGLNGQQYILTSSLESPITFYPTVPDLSQLTLVPQTLRQVDRTLNSPYVIQTAIGVERQLPRNTTVALNFTNSRGVHQLRTRNINAPDPNDDNLRPYGDQLGNIYNYEADGIYKQHQLIFNINTRVNPSISLFSFYVLNYAKSNTDGVSTFPMNQYDFDGEYGRASTDNRHRVFLGGSVGLRYGVRLSPFMVYRSGVPFNITVPTDLNGDSIFNDRPSLSTAPCPATFGAGGIYCNPYGEFNANPLPGETRIARNFAEGPDFFELNLRLSKSFGFGEKTTSSRPSGPDGGPRFGGPMGGPGGGFGGRGGGMRGPGGPGGMFGESSGHKYTLTLTAQARNIFNNVNLGQPISVLTPQFGAYNTIANFGPGGSSINNRRLEFGMRFSF